jgi:outer membrane receptor protein involved in Fe transport
MYITNLGDIQTTQGRIGTATSVILSENLFLRTEQSLEINRVELTDAGSFSYFEGLYNAPAQTRTRLLPAASATMEFTPSEFPLLISLSSSYSSRMPTFIELYGRYIYNYVDGFFYDGNPDLSPENSWNTDMSIQGEFQNQEFSVSVYQRLIYQFVAGIEDEVLSNQFYQFRRYENTGNARLTGTELRWLGWKNNAFTTDIRLSYLHAQHLDLNEPMPMISPLSGFISAAYNFGTLNFSASLDWAARQHRIAYLTTIEDRTPAFAVFNTDISKIWTDIGLTAQLSLHNLFDTYFHRHTSIGNIPELGRSLMLSFTFEL